MNKYTIQNKIGNVNLTTEDFSGFILENGSQIARISRKGAKRFRNDIKYTWFSERAKSRFEDFSNAESITETVEAIG